jgi:hypothetical protein
MTNRESAAPSPPISSAAAAWALETKPAAVALKDTAKKAARTVAIRNLTMRISLSRLKSSLMLNEFNRQGQSCNVRPKDKRITS